MLLKVAADKRLTNGHILPLGLKTAGWTITIAISLLSLVYLVSAKPVTDHRPDDREVPEAGSDA